jgi:hypothetical protein
MDEQELLEMKVLQNDPWVGSFYHLANGIWWRKMARYYWMICDHETLDYCGISKGLVSWSNKSCCRVSYGHHRQFLYGCHSGFAGKSSFSELDMVAGFFGIWVRTWITCLSWMEWREKMMYRRRRNDRMISKMYALIMCMCLNVMLHVKVWHWHVKRNTWL